MGSRTESRNLGGIDLRSVENQPKLVESAKRNTDRRSGVDRSSRLQSPADLNNVALNSRFKPSRDGPETETKAFPTNGIGKISVLPL